MFDSFVGVRAGSDKLDMVKEVLKGSFYTAKIDDHNRIVVKVPNSLDAIAELQEYFYTRLSNFKVCSI